MTKHDAIRAVLLASKKALTLDVLLPRLERRTKQIFGRSRLYRLLSVMQVMGHVASEGRGEERAYRWVGR